MDEQPFLAAVLDRPADPGPRLVFADWLEERGDPRGPWLRLSAQTLPSLVAGALQARVPRGSSVLAYEPGGIQSPVDWPTAISRLVAAVAVRALVSLGDEHVAAVLPDYTAGLPRWSRWSDWQRRDLAACKLRACGLLTHAGLLGRLGAAGRVTVSELVHTPARWPRHYQPADAERVARAVTAAGWPPPLKKSRARAKGADVVRRRDGPKGPTWLPALTNWLGQIGWRCWLDGDQGQVLLWRSTDGLSIGRYLPRSRKLYLGARPAIFCRDWGHLARVLQALAPVRLENCGMTSGIRASSGANSPSHSRPKSGLHYR